MSPIEKAVKVLQREGVLLVPTDTNYALAVDPWSVSACEKVYAIKQRDVKKPLTLFLASPEEIQNYVELSRWQRETFSRLMHFLPGPLNLVLPKSAQAPDHQFIKEDSISLVCNSQPALQALLRAWGRPLALTSANISGIEHAGLIDHSLAEATFGRQVDYVLPGGGTSTTTTSSTIVSLLGDRLTVIRQGDIRIGEIYA
ncbi:L-threonylcarbamoyladenylate synthase [Kalamiella sp. sgz302252]|uniref:L-threonylcarbamoyladenylate synthase n=1 Tax=Pantoea sp. sgz302252 TaxID=3341827 RepID=UPI0036D2FCDB